MDSFDADVLIYAAVADHELGRRVHALFPIGPLGVSHAPAGPRSISEIDITYPADLPDPDTG